MSSFALPKNISSTIFCNIQKKQKKMIYQVLALGKPKKIMRRSFTGNYNNKIVLHNKSSLPTTTNCYLENSLVEEKVRIN